MGRREGESLLASGSIGKDVGFETWLTKFKSQLLVALISIMIGASLSLSFLKCKGPAFRVVGWNYMGRSASQCVDHKSCSAHVNSHLSFPDSLISLRWPQNCCCTGCFTSSFPTMAVFVSLCVWVLSGGTRMKRAQERIWVLPSGQGKNIGEKSGPKSGLYPFTATCVTLNKLLRLPAPWFLHL